LQIPIYSILPHGILVQKSESLDKAQRRTDYYYALYLKTGTRTHYRKVVVFIQTANVVGKFH